MAGWLPVPELRSARRPPLGDSPGGNRATGLDSCRWYLFVERKVSCAAAGWRGDTGLVVRVAGTRGLSLEGVADTQYVFAAP